MTTQFAPHLACRRAVYERLLKVRKRLRRSKPKNDAIVMSQITSTIPVNVITGFLGVGKTSSILKLVEQKPADQEWAILVNEFGEIGVDRGLVRGQLAPRNDVMVFEVPGGCMCCAAGLPMEMALSQIFFLGEPDRLIIEPTGLGHPAEVLGVLASEAYGFSNGN